MDPEMVWLGCTPTRRQALTEHERLVRVMVSIVRHPLTKVIDFNLTLRRWEAR